jgi:hypothetical protein
VSLGVVDVLQIRFIGDVLDPRWRGRDVFVAGHHRDGSKFEAFADFGLANGRDMSE